MADSAKRLTFWGSYIVAVLGVILSLNAGLSNDYTGAGVCLVASALAIGVISHTFLRK